MAGDTIFFDEMHGYGEGVRAPYKVYDEILSEMTPERLMRQSRKAEDFFRKTGITFFQIGETKYGRPIILRAFDPAMSAEQAIRLLCVSFDSTLRANLSVGMPLDVHIYAADSLKSGDQFRIDESDASFAAILSGWGCALKSALEALPLLKVSTE